MEGRMFSPYRNSEALCSLSAQISGQSQHTSATQCTALARQQAAPRGVALSPDPPSLVQRPPRLRRCRRCGPALPPDGLFLQHAGQARQGKAKRRDAAASRRRRYLSAYPRANDKWAYQNAAAAPKQQPLSLPALPCLASPAAAARGHPRRRSSVVSTTPGDGESPLMVLVRPRGGSGGGGRLAPPPNASFAAMSLSFHRDSSPQSTRVGSRLLRSKSALVAIDLCQL